MPEALILTLTPIHERRAHYAALRVGVKAGFGCVRLGFIGTTLLMTFILFVLSWKNNAHVAFVSFENGVLNQGDWNAINLHHLTRF